MRPSISSRLGRSAWYLSDRKTKISQPTVLFFSSNSKKGKKEALEYLQSWIGKANTTSTTPTSSSVKSSGNTDTALDNNGILNQNKLKKDSSTQNSTSNAPVRPLYITGSSYLLPTLRLQRSDTPKSLAHQIDSSFSKSNSGHPSTTMLIGKLLQSSNPIQRWKVPLILDLGDFQPDGSPHFVPPTRDLLTGIINVLHDRGIKIMGIANAPINVGGNSTMNSENENVEEIVYSLGLPPVMGTRSNLNQQKLTMSMEDIVQMVHTKKETHEEIIERGNNCETKVKIKQESENEETSMESKKTHLEYENKADDNNTNDDQTEKNTVSHLDQSDVDDSSSLSFSAAHPPPPQTSAKIYHGNVRTGQQISAEQNRSLIILGSVHSGGEVMADADIYVYGKLNGRALAGLNGGSRARILASQFDPELVCIGGIYTTVDDVTDFGLSERGCPALVEVDVEEGVLKFQEISI